MEARHVVRVYLILLLLNTLAASLIWGINTLFLLDAGLNNLEAFAANAFFTAGMMIFEVPTGVVADTWGRRTSYLLGAATLMLSTLSYLLVWQLEAPFWAWAVTSLLLGLGYTFFSGAVEAWLVDALKFTKYQGSLESVFAKGQVVTGVAMLTGSVGGGLLAQVTNLGVPYVVRAVILGITFAVAFALMRDLGFKPAPRQRPVQEMRSILSNSLKYGLGNPSVRWIMLTAPFTMGVSVYVFYAMQPFLLELYGDPKAYSIAGLAAAIVAGAQILGGLAAPSIRRLFRRRTTVLLVTVVLNTFFLVAIGIFTHFLVAILLLVVWGLLFAASMPVRQAYLNALIPSKQRATVLSFDGLLGSGGGTAVQPLLGKAADVWSYAFSYVLAAAFQVLAVPCVLLARRYKVEADHMLDMTQTIPIPKPDA